MKIHKPGSDPARIAFAMLAVGSLASATTVLAKSLVGTANPRAVSSPVPLASVCIEGGAVPTEDLLYVEL